MPTLPRLIVSSVALGASPRTPCSIRSARSAASAAPRSRSRSRGRRLGDAQEILFYQPGIDGDHHQEGQRQRRQGHAQDRARLAARPARPAGPHGDRASASCGRFSVGALKDVTEVEPNNDFAKPQPIAMNVDGQRRRRQRGRRLLRRRGEEGRSDLGRGRGHPAGDHLVRPVRGDPRRQAVRAGGQRRRGPGLAGRLRLDHRARGRQVHHPGPRERLRGQRQLPLPAARRQLPAADGGDPGRRQARRDGGGPLDRRRARARRRRTVTLPAAAPRPSFGLVARTSRGSPPIPTLPAQRRSAT